MALENINREILDQIPNMELASELAPYIENSPLARMGFDAKLATVLPDNLAYATTDPNTQESLLGRYIQPDYPVEELDPLISRSFLNYSRNPLDSIIAFSQDGSRSREDLLSTLAHESAHRGSRLLPPETYNKYGMMGIIDETRVRLNDYYNGSPATKDDALDYLNRLDMTVEEANDMTRYDEIQQSAANYLKGLNRPYESAPEVEPSIGENLLSYFK